MTKQEAIGKDMAIRQIEQELGLKPLGLPGIDITIRELEQQIVKLRKVIDWLKELKK